MARQTIVPSAGAALRRSRLLMSIALLSSVVSPPPAQAYCTCRLVPLASFGNFWIYLAEERDTCAAPDGCSPPISVLMSDAPGLPPQYCPSGECESSGSSAAASQDESGEEAWAIRKPYPANFSLFTASNSNPAFSAVLPGRPRPAVAVQQDFTLLGETEGQEVHVRTFKAERKIRFAGPDGKELDSKLIVYAVGAEFEDKNLADNIVIPFDEHWSGEGQKHCRRFFYQYPEDDGDTNHMVLTVGSK